MDFVSGLLYTPVDESKKNDDLTKDDTLLVVNLWRHEITIVGGNHKIGSGKEKRIPFSQVISFKVGNFLVHKLRIDETANGFFHSFWRTYPGLYISYENGVLTFTGNTSWSSCDVINRSNTNLTVISINTSSNNQTIVSAKTYHPIFGFHCIYDDEANLIYCAGADRQFESRFQITRKPRTLLGNDTLIVEDK